MRLRKIKLVQSPAEICSIPERTLIWWVDKIDSGLLYILVLGVGNARSQTKFPCLVPTSLTTLLWFLSSGISIRNYFVILYCYRNWQMVLLVERGFSANLNTLMCPWNKIWCRYGHLPWGCCQTHTNTNGKTETKNTKLKIRDSKMRKTNRKTKMDSKKHGGRGRKGVTAGRKKKETKTGIAAKNL